MRLKAALLATAITLALAAPAAAAPQDYFPNACGRPATGIWDSYETGHSWIGVWTGTDVARGAPSDGVWRLYAAAYAPTSGGGWTFAYYYWTSCYY